MIDEGLRRRFGDIAIRKGFITKEQLIEAMTFQIENELEGKQPKLIGSILTDLGYLLVAVSPWAIPILIGNAGGLAEYVGMVISLVARIFYELFMIIVLSPACLFWWL